MDDDDGVGLGEEGAGGERNPSSRRSEGGEREREREGGRTKGRVISGARGKEKMTGLVFASG